MVPIFGSSEVFSFAIMLIPLYFLSTKKLNFMLYPTLAAPILIFINEAFNLPFLDFTASHKLILAYSAIGAFMILMMMRSNWNFTQALPIATLLVFAGSFYWEIPYLITNAFISGFEWDWILHISGIVPFIALYYLVGIEPTDNTKTTLVLFSLGFYVSIIIMIMFYVPFKTGNEAIWDAPIYLANRLICTYLLFRIYNTVTPPRKGIIYKDKD